MKNLLLVIFTSLVLGISLYAQTNPATPTQNTSAITETKAKKPIFRATKEQITQAQKMLKATETGKMDDAFREKVKEYQTANGLRATGSLNRATLEKMGIVLTDKQKEIPVNPKSFASGDGSKTKRGPVFRATKEQIMEAQKLMKTKGLYAGEATGKLDPATRAGLKSFQEANGLKGTGTLNAVTLEKLGIALTDRQKEIAVAQNERTSSGSQ